MPNQDQDYSGVGRDLRRARVAGGHQIADVAQVLRIGTGHLTALEEGRYSELPAAVYVLGFVRAYAGFVQLDADEMVRRVHQEHYAASETEGLNFPAAPPELHSPSAGIMRFAIFIAVAVFGAWYFFDGAQDAPEQHVAQPPAGFVAAPPPVTMENTAADTGPQAMDTAPEAPVIPSVDELVKSGGAAENTSASTGQNEAPPQAAEPEAASAEGAAIENMPAGGAAPAPSQPEKREESVELPTSPPLRDGAAGAALAMAGPSAPPQVPILLRASADTWMQVIRTDGSEVKSWVLRAGQDYVPSGEEGLTLTIGNAGALSLYIDGVPVAPLGETGAVLRALPLDAAGLRARFGR